MTDETAPKPKKIPLAFKIKADLKLWKTPYEEGCADFVWDGVRRSMPILSKAFKAHIYAWCALREMAPSSTTVDNCALCLEALALTQGDMYEPAHRVGRSGSAIYYDAEDGRVVRFEGGAWKHEVDAPIRFLRGSGHLPQVRAVATTEHLYGLLGRFLKCERKDLVLLAAWLVGAMKPGGPYPILIINGEQGSAKSTTTRLLARIIDPHAREIREPPGNTRDFVAAVRNSYVLAFDNVSRIPHWFSDTLCRLATGTGAIGGRALYTDTDEVAFMAVRPVIINGIPDFVERSDLRDRTLGVSLPSIPPELRRDDDTFWAEFTMGLPEILGALYAVVARAHRDFDATVIPSPPRMANFARWVCAGLGKGGTEFLDILNEDRQEASESQLEHDHIAQALIQFLNQHVEGFSGTLFDLLRKLQQWSPGDKNYWPSTPLQLYNAVRRINPTLRRAGILWEKAGRQGGTGRSLVKVKRASNWKDLGFAVSAGQTSNG